MRPSRRSPDGAAALDSSSRARCSRLACCSFFADFCRSLGTRRRELALVNGASTGILDNFNRANETPLSPSGFWAPTGVDGGAVLALSNKQVNGSGKSAYRTATLSGSMEAYATISAGPASLQALTVFIDLNDVGTAGWDGYGLRLINSFSTNKQYRLRKITNGAETDLASWDEPFSGAGERLLIKKEGSTIEAWKSATGGGAWTLSRPLLPTRATRADASACASPPKAAVADPGTTSAEAAPPVPLSPAQSNGTFGGSGTLAKTTSFTLSDPVNTLTGSFVNQVQDLSLPGTGVTFDWTRSYTSGDVTVGTLGPGWTHSYVAKLLIEGDGNITARGQEGQELFFAKQPDGSFVSAPGRARDAHPRGRCVHAPTFGPGLLHLRQHGRPDLDQGSKQPGADLRLHLGAPGERHGRRGQGRDRLLQRLEPRESGRAPRRSQRELRLHLGPPHLGH